MLKNGVHRVTLMREENITLIDMIIKVFLVICCS